VQKNLLLLLLCLSAPLLVTVGCDKGGNNFNITSASEQFPSGSGSATAVNNQLDILFVINDQPSMSSFQDELVASMSTFMSTFQTKGFDYKIAVVTTSGYMADPTLNGYNSINVAEADFNDFNGTVHSNVHVITPADPNIFSNFAINAKPSKNTSGQDNRAFSSFRQALQTLRPINAGFLRPNSFLAVIIVDNQDDFSGNGRCVGCNNNQRYNAPTLDAVTVYKDFLDQLTGTSGATARYNVSAMAQTVSTCQGSTLSTRIMDLVNQTNGVLGDICQADFGISMTAMANKITLLSTQYYLARVPVLSSIRVIIDGVQILESATDGWTYDSAANSIQFHGSAIPQQGANIVVNYDPATI
jgi:hypothetical protein